MLRKSLIGLICMTMSSSIVFSSIPVFATNIDSISNINSNENIVDIQEKEVEIKESEILDEKKDEMDIAVDETEKNEMELEEATNNPIVEVTEEEVVDETYNEFIDEGVSVTGSYDIIVEGYDWGPGVSKAIITLDNEIDEVDATMFNVEESKVWYAGIQSFNRTVTKAYLSDSSGNVVKGSSKNITLELQVHPDEGNPFLYNLTTGRNNWAEQYSLTITLADGVKLKSQEKEVVDFIIEKEYSKKELSIVSAFKEATYKAEGDIAMNYAYYEPAKDNEKNPLVIWLHGAGEGGTDTTIATLGNKVSAMIEEEIQGDVGSSYVLAPQSPTMWMDSTGNSQYTTNGDTIYLESLMNLIKSYVNSNPDIDTDRIYIGGCSNGGFMTMALILENPEYFAAAYPICEAYQDSWITDEKLEGIKDMPIWFTYASNDEVVNPKTTSMATIERLRKMGAENIKVSQFKNVVDTSGLYKDENGQAYEYNGHWSWIYAFNNECKDGQDSLWSWLGNQALEAPIKDDEITEEDKTEDDKDNNLNNGNQNNGGQNNGNSSNGNLNSNNNSNNNKPNNNRPNNNSVNSNSNNTNKLPNTGEQNYQNIITLSALLSIISGAIIAIKNKKIIK